MKSPVLKARMQQDRFHFPYSVAVYEEHEYMKSKSRLREQERRKGKHRPESVKSDNSRSEWRSFNRTNSGYDSGASVTSGEMTGKASAFTRSHTLDSLNESIMSNVTERGVTPTVSPQADHPPQGEPMRPRVLFESPETPREDRRVSRCRCKASALVCTCHIRNLIEGL